MGETLIQNNKASSEPVSTHSPLMVRNDGSRHNTPQPQTHSARPRPPRAFHSAQACYHPQRAKPPPAAGPPDSCPPTTTPGCRRWSRPGSNHSSGSGWGAPGPGRSHPGATLSVPAPCPSPAIGPETYPCRARPHLSGRSGRRRLHLEPVFLFPRRVRLRRPAGCRHWRRGTRLSILIGSGSRPSRQDRRNVDRVPD